MTKWFCLVALVAYTNAGVVKRGLADYLVGTISNFGSSVLPEESMRNGCASVGLYNREKDGSPPRRDSNGGLSGMVGSGLAQFGDTIFSKSGMEEGCMNAGFYDPNLDENGQPKNQGQFKAPWAQGGGSGQMGGGTTNFYLNGGGQGQQQQTKKKTFKCFRNGVQVECDAATIAQANGK